MTTIRERDLGRHLLFEISIAEYDIRSGSETGTWIAGSAITLEKKDGESS